MAGDASAADQQGARAWPDPRDGTELGEALTAAVHAAAAEPKQETLSLTIREKAPGQSSEPISVLSAADSPLSPADELLQSVREILIRELAEPRSQAEVAKLLSISKPQAKAWLAKLVEAGDLEKSAEPMRVLHCGGFGTSSLIR